VESDGNFTFAGIPVGKYTLMIQLSSTKWYSIGEFVVNPGTNTEFGKIAYPPK
jgi:hypothetical protein